MGKPDPIIMRDIYGQEMGIGEMRFPVPIDLSQHNPNIASLIKKFLFSYEADVIKLLEHETKQDFDIKDSEKEELFNLISQFLSQQLVTYLKTAPSIKLTGRVEACGPSNKKKPFSGVGMGEKIRRKKVKKVRRATKTVEDVIEEINVKKLKQMI